MSQIDDEKYIRDAGWKIHSKSAGRKFWQSPYDQRVYVTGHAVIAERVAEATRQDEAKVARAEADQAVLATMDRFMNWEEGTLEEIAPLPEKVRKKRPSKKTIAKNIKELGYE